MAGGWSKDGDVSKQVDASITTTDADRLYALIESLPNKQ